MHPVVRCIFYRWIMDCVLSNMCLRAGTVFSSGWDKCAPSQPHSFLGVQSDTPRGKVPGPGWEMWLVPTEQIFFSLWGSLVFHIGIESWCLLPCVLASSWKCERCKLFKDSIVEFWCSFFFFSPFLGGSLRVFFCRYQEIVRLAYLGGKHDTLPT